MLTEELVVFSPARSIVALRLPHNQAVVSEEVARMRIRHEEGHICHEARHARQRRLDLSEPTLVRAWKGMLSGGQCTNLAAQGHVICQQVPHWDELTGHYLCHHLLRYWWEGG